MLLLWLCSTSHLPLLSSLSHRSENQTCQTYSSSFWSSACPHSCPVSLLFNWSARGRSEGSGKVSWILKSKIRTCTLLTAVFVMTAVTWSPVSCYFSSWKQTRQKSQCCSVGYVPFRLVCKHLFDHNWNNSYLIEGRNHEGNAEDNIRH